MTVEGTVVAEVQPPTPAAMLTITSRYLPPDAASGMVEQELGNPDTRLVLFTVRPDRWLTFDVERQG